MTAPLIQIFFIVISRMCRYVASPNVCRRAIPVVVIRPARVASGAPPCGSRAIVGGTPSGAAAALAHRVAGAQHVRIAVRGRRRFAAYWLAAREPALVGPAIDGFLARHGQLAASRND
jgi:hypothetical protein